MQRSVLTTRKVVSVLPSALLVAAVCLLLPLDVAAAPYHAPTIDGTIAGDGVDWIVDDHMIDDLADDSPTAIGNARDLWITWDADNLYIGAYYQAIGASMLIYLDTGAGVGTNDGMLLESFPREVVLPDGRAIDMVIAQNHASGFDVGTPSVFRAVDGSGALTDVTTSTNAAQTYRVDTVFPEKRFLWWFTTEIAIPWSVIYPEGMPNGAVLRAALVSATISDGGYAYDSAPGLGRHSGNTPVVLQSMQASILDPDGDGDVDPLGASVSGLVTLPADPGDVAINALARLTSDPYDLDGPVSVFRGESGVREWRTGRLAAGNYDITISAEGYLSETINVTVSADETVTDQDVTLIVATTVAGTLRLELGQFSGGYRFLAPDGAILAAANLLPSAFPFHFSFYVVDSGTYTLEAWGNNHLSTSFPINVVSGVDLTGLDLIVPHAPRLSGAVSFVSGPGAPTTVVLANAAGDTVFATAMVTPAAPGFSFYAPRLGALALLGTADTYAGGVLTLNAVAGLDQPDLELSLARLPEVNGTVAFIDGPGHGGMIVVAPATGDAAADTLVFDSGGADFRLGGPDAPFFVAEGDYTVTVDADGYGVWSTEATFAGLDGVTDLGVIDLTAVRADRLHLLDMDGLAVESLSGTISVPDSNFYSYTRLDLEAVDPDGRRDLFDLDAKLAGLPLTARKMNDVAAPSGFARFLASEDVDDVISTVDFSGGSAGLWMANDAVEVLRIFVGPEVPDPLKDGVEPPTGRFMIGFRPPEPETVVLSASKDSLTADNDDTIIFEAQLYDSAGNASPLPDHPVTFLLETSSTGVGSFEQSTVTTNGDGLATATLKATGSGTLLVTVSTVVNNAVLDVRLFDVDGEPGPMAIRSQPGPTAAWSFVAAPRITSLSAPIAVSAQLVDAFGNATLEQGITASFSVAPAAFGGFDVISPTSNAQGRVTTSFQPTGLAGLATLSVTGPSLGNDSHDLQVRDVMIVSDPPSDLEPEGHASIPPVDLTTVIVENTPTALRVTIPFATTFADMILHLLIETEGDAAGASVDPFEQPVNYGHALRPDYVLTSKLGWDSNYSDLRRWDTTDNRYFWWDTEGEAYISTANSGDWVEGIKLQDRWVFQGADSITMTIPWTPFGSIPDSVRVEVYITQESQESDPPIKRSAFDSAPQDNTLDLDFDYENPEPGDWDIAAFPVTLSAWSDPYPVRSSFPTSPTITAATVAPDTLGAGAPFVVSARITDAGDGIGDVVVDLSPMAGAALTRMYDDGLPTHGDTQAGDGLWSMRATVPLGAPGGMKSLTVSAYDGDNVIATSATAMVFIAAHIDVLVHAEDPIGDDHGPNQEGVEGKYYTYPTNSVFVSNGFDIESLDVYETVAVVNGLPVDMIAFAVKIGDFPDPADPTTADWGAFYGDMNIQKIDILLDTGPGGSTRSLPNRLVDVEPWNAWDYAVIMDGWYKALVPSFGQNTVESWRENALKTDGDIQIVGNFETDVITALVSKEALGNPSSEDIAGWGMAVLMSSHDFGGEEVLGGIRWVNESLSEWNFGGGHYTDRDPNIMDLLLVPGAGREHGRPQQEILDFETERAVARLERGETPCALEMSRQIDTGPPVIRIVRNRGEVVQRLPLRDAPIAFSLIIEDDTGVQESVFRYRDAAAAASGWAFEDTMGYAGNNLWTVDLPQQWVDSALIASPIDGARYVEFEIEARDFGTDVDPPKVTISPVVTLQLDPAVDRLWIQGTMAAGEISLRHVDGSVLTISDRLRSELLAAAAELHPDGISADSLATVASLGWEIAQPAAEVRSAPSVPAGTAVDAFRSIALDIGDAGWTTVLDGRLPRTFDLTLHYLDSAVPAGRDEQKIGLFEYHDTNQRWVLVGGNVNAGANQVTASVNHEGTYGLFWTEALDYDPGEVISGIEVSPNPFSPNGDGLYDEAFIGFFLSQEATVTVEVFNIDGKLKRRLLQTFPFGGDATGGAAPQRSSGLIWDGTDSNGDYVPYGIYILRLIVTYNQAGGQRTIRSNHPVAVIR